MKFFESSSSPTTDKELCCCGHQNAVAPRKNSRTAQDVESGVAGSGEGGKSAASIPLPLVPPVQPDPSADKLNVPHSPPLNTQTTTTTTLMENGKK